MSPSTDTMPPETLRAPGRLELAAGVGPNGPDTAAQGGPRQYRARLITAGTIRAQGNRPSNLEIPASTLQAALDAHLFDGRPAFVDHPSWLDDYPSLRNLAGVVTDCAWDPGALNDEKGLAGAITGAITLYPTEAGRVVADLFDQVLADTAAGRPAPDIGLSAVLWCRWERKALSDEKGTEADGQSWHMAEIQHVESVDFVFEPGADGRVQAALTALRALPAPLGVTGREISDPESPNSLGNAGNQVEASNGPNQAPAPLHRPDGPEGGASGGPTGGQASAGPGPNYAALAAAHAHPVGAALAAAQAHAAA
ncbi:MAG: hypothetical protein GX597_20860, partial [Anaerolineaceae bacterium]|nr:hypothetical protein [Anaerolineaceae bacterium]